MEETRAEETQLKQSDVISWIRPEIGRFIVIMLIMISYFITLYRLPAHNVKILGYMTTVAVSIYLLSAGLEVYKKLDQRMQIKINEIERERRNVETTLINIIDSYERLKKDPSDQRKWEFESEMNKVTNERKQRFIK